MTERICAMGDASAQELAAADGGTWSTWFHDIIDAFCEGFTTQLARNK